MSNTGPLLIIGTVCGDVSPSTNINAPKKDSKPDPIYLGFKRPDPKFTGRMHELNLLEDAINNYQRNPPGDNPIAVVICGLGGVGKTQLLRKYITQKQLPPTPSYHNVVWINSQSISLMMNAFTDLADQLRIEFGMKDKVEDKDLQSVIPKVLNRLSTWPTVIIFDNVDEEENKKIIKIVLTTEVSGTRPHVIITSRIQKWSASINAITLEVFNADDALEYVSSKLWNPKNIYDDSKEALALVELVQNFPLALTQAVAHINHHREYVREYSIGDYILEYSKHLTITLGSNFFQDDDFNLYDQTTLTTWKVTIAAIKNDEAVGKLALKILHIIAYFNPDHILRDIFFHLADVGDVIQAVILLVNYSMLNSHNQSVLSVHRLVQQVTKIELEHARTGHTGRSGNFFPFRYWFPSTVRPRSTPPETPFVSQAGSELEGSADATRAILQDALEIILKMKENCNFEQCLEHGISVFLAASNIKELVHRYKTFPVMLLCHLNRFRKFHQAINSGQEIVKKLAPILDEIDKEILTCKFWIAVSHRSVNNFFESLRIDSEVLEKRKEILGENDRNTLASKTNVAIGITYMGRNVEALKMHQEVLKKQIAILQKNENELEIHLDILDSKFRIAIVYSKLGQLSKSLSMHQEVYEQRKQILSEDHPDTLDSLTNIGIVFIHLGKISDALQIHQFVYNKRKAIGLRDDDPHVLHSKTEIALSYRFLGKSAEAASMYEELFEQSKKTFGEVHPKTLDHKNKIGVMYNIMGRHADALRIHTEVLNERRIMFEEDSARILQCKSMIAETYSLSGDYTTALLMFEDIHDRAKIALGEDVLLTLSFKVFVAHCYRNLGDYYNALRIYEETFDKHKEKWGADDINAVDSQFEIANTYNDLGRYDEALQLHEDVFEKRNVTQEHANESTTILPRILDSKSKIADTYNHLGKHAEALQLHQEVFDERKTISADNLPIILQCKSDIADTYNNLGEHSKACLMHQDVYKQRRIILGENHPHTVDSKFRIAISLNKLGEHAPAYQTHQEVYDQRSTTLGKNHPDTLDSKFHIAISLNNLGKQSLARQMHQKVYEQRMIVLGDNHPHTLNSKKKFELQV